MSWGGGLWCVALTVCGSDSEHRRAIEKAIQRHHINQPTAVSDHFSLPGHSINNIELIPLELIKSNRDGIRKEREALLISKGKTLEPHGINRRDETQSV